MELRLSRGGLPSISCLFSIVWSKSFESTIPFFQNFSISVVLLLHSVQHCCCCTPTTAAVSTNNQHTAGSETKQTGHLINLPTICYSGDRKSNIFSTLLQGGSFLDFPRVTISKHIVQQYTAEVLQSQLVSFSIRKSAQSGNLTKNQETTREEKNLHVKSR